MNYISFVKTAIYTRNVYIQFNADSLRFVAQFAKLFSAHFTFTNVQKKSLSYSLYYYKLVSTLN